MTIPTQAETLHALANRLTNTSNSAVDLLNRDWTMGKRRRDLVLRWIDEMQEISGRLYDLAELVLMEGPAQ